MIHSVRFTLFASLCRDAEHGIIRRRIRLLSYSTLAAALVCGRIARSGGIRAGFGDARGTYNKMRLHKTFLSISLLAIGALASHSAFAQELQYQVTVNTTSALAQMGYIEFQFNNGPLTTQPANADVNNFFTDGVLTPPGTNTNESSGMLPGTVSQDNSTSFDDYIEEMTFGTTITFDLVLYGPAISNPNGDGGGTFTLDFLNSDQSGYLFTADSQNDVPVFTVDINPDGTTTAMSYPSQNNGPSVVTFSGPTAVPEPSSIALLCGGLLVLAFFGRRRMLANAVSESRSLS
jgi:hypothetical protein